MERRDFLKFAFGVAAGTAVLAASAQAAPLSPQPSDELTRLPRGNVDAQPAVTNAAEAAQLEPEQVHWRRHRGWHRHHWRRRWHHRRWRRW